MKLSRRLMSEPVQTGCRRVALAMLDQAAEAFTRLRKGGDAEALHAFRVAVRRLRTCLKAYRDHLDGKLAGKLRDRLGKLMRTTNADRDAQVHMTWLREQLASDRPSERQRTGIRIVLDDIESTVSVDVGQALSAVPPRVLRGFPSLEAKLRRRLSSAGRKGRRRKTAATGRFAAVTGALIHQQARQLGDHLGLIHDAGDEAAVHQARLTAKRLRYLLEPIRKRVPDGKASVEQLKTLQDVLGELHDLQTLKQRVAKLVESSASAWARQLVDDAGRTDGQATVRRDLSGRRACYALTSLVRLIVTMQRRRFGQLHHAWLGGRAGDFFAGIDRIYQHLDPLPTTEEGREVIGDRRDDSATKSPVRGSRS